MKDETKKSLERIAVMTDPIQFLQILADGAKFTVKAKKFEEELHKKLDKMVENGELTEHEARFKFWNEFQEYTDNSAHDSAKRIMGWGSNDDEEEDDDAVDEVDGEEETGEETDDDFGDSSDDLHRIDIHIHCHDDSGK